MKNELSALALISEQIGAGSLSVFMFWRRNHGDNHEQIELLYLTRERACQAATEWIATYHYNGSGTDPEDGWEPPRTGEEIKDWFEEHEEAIGITGGVWELVVNLDLT